MPNRKRWKNTVRFDPPFLSLPSLVIETDERIECSFPVPKETIKRPRAESAEEKKARKALVKEERQSRRSEKKATKDVFAGEVKRQKKIGGRRVADGGAADIRPGTEGVRKLA